jgi:hypothetical protein
MANATTPVIQINEGNVGIGTTSPVAKLHLSGAGATELRIASTTGNTNSLLSFYEGALASWGIDAGQANGSFFIKDLYNSTTRVTINYTGKVGIGVTAPQQKLTLGSVSAGGIQFNYDSTDNYRHQILNYWNSNTDSRMDFNIARSSGQTPETILSVGYGGNVGIGTTTPDALLEISGNAGADPGPITNPTTFRITDAGNAATGAGDTTNDWGKIEFYSEDQSSSGPSVQAQIGTIYDNIYSTASNLAFKTRTSPTAALTERLRIKTSGALSFYAYSGSNNTGTPTYLLGTDASGDVFKTNTIPGSAAGPYLPLAGGALSGTGRVLTVTSTNDQVVASIKCSASGVPSTLGFQGDGSTSDYHVRVGANTTNFVAYTNNIERMRIASGGNVGIGVTSLTSAKLEVSDSATQAGILITSDGGNEQFKIRRYSNNNEQLILGFHSSDYAQIQAVEQGVAYRPLALNPNGGNVGIGTTDPASNLHLHSASSATVMKISNSSSGVGAFDGMAIALGNGFSQLWYYENGYFRIATNNSERMRITSTGDVGIGITSPGAKLDVYNSSGNVYQAFIGGSVSKLMINGNLSGGGVALQSAAANSSSDYSICPSTVYDLFMQSCGGNVMIGSGTPTAKLEVNGQTKTKSLTYLEPTGNSEYRGEIVYFGAFESGIFDTNGGELVCLGSTGGGTPVWRKADDNTLNRATGMLGITLGSTVASGVLVRGFARSAAYSGFSDGGKCYISATDGDMTTTAPTGNNKYLRIVGYVVDSITGAAEIYFCPDNTYVQITV